MPGSRLPILAPERLLEDRPGLRAAAALELRRRDPGAAGRVPRAGRPLHHPDPGAAHRMTPAAPRPASPPSRRADHDERSSPRPTIEPARSCGERASAAVLRGARRPGAPGQAGAQAAPRRSPARRATSGCASARLRLRLERRVRSGARCSYEDDYESTQAVSPTFNRFHERLAREPDRALRPARQEGGRDRLRPGRVHHDARRARRQPRLRLRPGDPRRPAATGKVTLVKDFYAERYSHLRPDFVCCKMTLEHVHDVARVPRAACARTVGDRPRGRGLLHDPGDHADPRACARSGTSTTSTARTSARARSRAPFRHRRLRPARGLDRLRRPVRADRGAARRRQRRRRSPNEQPPAALARQGRGLRPRRRRGPRALARLARRAARAPGKQDRALGRRLQGGGLPHHARHHRRDRATRSTSTRGAAAPSSPAPASRSWRRSSWPSTDPTS